MQKQIKNALILLLAFFALLSVLGFSTGAFSTLKSALPGFFAAASALFIASIFVWLVSWAILIKARQTSLIQTVLLGFGCVFGALTPVQIGADALRSVKLKEFAGVGYTESIAASMVVKGIKFLVIAGLASIAFLLSFFNASLSGWIKAAMLSGFAVVALAAALFLLPFHKPTGLRIASFFQRAANFFRPFGRLSQYFQKYTSYLQRISIGTIALVSVLALVSLLLEFLALWFSFLSANLMMPIFNTLILFSILSILERTPFLPRGIGVVEAAGFVFLSLSSFTGTSFSPSEIVTVIILFDLVRLVIPTIASLFVYSVLFSTGKGLKSVDARQSK